MKLKLNQILAAALVAAASVPAMASIAKPSTGNGELFLVVWDQVDKVSYVKDLGIFMDSFNGNADLSYSLNDANFTGFLGMANTTVSDIKFSVMAGDSGGVKRLFSTVDSALTPYGNQNLTDGTAFLNNFTSFQVTESLHTTHAGGTAVNGTSYDTEGKNAYFLTGGYGPNLQTSTMGAWTNSNLVGTSSVFRSFSSVGLAGGNPTLQSDFLGQWNVTQNNGAWTAAYNVAAIPEPSSIAMMLAGLGVLGFVARRRRQG